MLGLPVMGILSSMQLWEGLVPWQEEGAVSLSLMGRRLLCLPCRLVLLLQRG